MSGCLRWPCDASKPLCRLCRRSNRERAEMAEIGGSLSCSIERIDKLLRLGLRCLELCEVSSDALVLIGSARCNAVPRRHGT